MANWEGMQRPKLKQNAAWRQHQVRITLNEKSLGNDLLSQGATPQVPSALATLTSGFGMLPGVPSPLQSPRDIFLYSSE